MLLGAPSQTHSSFLAKKWLELEVERALLAVWQLVLVARDAEETIKVILCACQEGGKAGEAARNGSFGSN